MKPLLRALFASGLVLVASTLALRAQPFLFDENGHGTNLSMYSYGTPLLAEVGPDPTGGILGKPVLMYCLPPAPYPISSGNVALLDWQGRIADVLRFYNGPLGPRIIVYSAIDSTAHSLADVGIPPISIATFIPETAPETWWTPLSGQPGAYTGPALPMGELYRYMFVPDVPEPAASALLGAAAAVWLFAGARRRR
jgi:hypothetical protein